MSSDPGSFIWYELITTDADAAAKFYGAVVGWNIAPRAEAPSAPDHRLIARDDGGSAGGVMTITPDMQRRGARPTWLGYLFTPDVGAAIASIEADGGRCQMRMTLPVGDIAMVTDPTGAPFYVMKPAPPANEPAASPVEGWLFDFGVDSVAAAQRAIVASGGEVILGAHEVPGGDWIVLARDPQGAAFGVVGPRGA